MILEKAAYWRRIVAWMIDVLVVGCLAALVTFGGIAALANDFPLLGLSFLFVGPLSLLGFVIWNEIFRQGKSGQTIGKSLAGTRLVACDSGAPVGAGLAIGRVVVAWGLNLVTGGLFALVDLLFPVFDSQGQRVVDKMLSTRVVSATGTQVEVVQVASSSASWGNPYS